jgi:hypothetical protein
MDFVQRWLVMIAASTILFAIGLLVLRINLRSLLIFYIIGMSAITLWMIVDKRFFASNSKNKNAKDVVQCACPVCNHENQATCFQDKCACCLIMKNNKVIGHSSSVLQ